MARMSDNQLIQCAITPALNDRTTFLDAVKGDAETEELTRAEITVIEALRGKKLSKLSPEERRAAMLALLYAAQWESSYADADPSSEAGAQSRKEAERYRKARHRLFGRTKLERMMDEATSVDVTKLLQRS